MLRDPQAHHVSLRKGKGTSEISSGPAAVAARRLGVRSRHPGEKRRRFEHLDLGPMLEDIRQKLPVVAVGKKPDQRRFSKVLSEMAF